jgi:hypothetical protein
MQYAGELALPHASAHRDSRKRKLPHPDSVGKRSTKLATVTESTVETVSPLVQERGHGLTIDLRIRFQRSQWTTRSICPPSFEVKRTPISSCESN